MAGKPGRAKTGGRVAGTPNKTTASVKAALHEAFERKGGVPALLEWAQNNETEFYKLWGRLVPTETHLSTPGGAVFSLIVHEHPRQ